MTRVLWGWWECKEGSGKSGGGTLMDSYIRQARWSENQEGHQGEVTQVVGEAGSYLLLRDFYHPWEAMGAKVSVCSTYLKASGPIWRCLVQSLRAGLFGQRMRSCGKENLARREISRLNPLEATKRPSKKPTTRFSCQKTRGGSGETVSTVCNAAIAGSLFGCVVKEGPPFWIGQKKQWVPEETRKDQEVGGNWIENRE